MRLVLLNGAWVKMISSDDRNLIHRYIVNDLMYRTLLRDRRFIHYFKMDHAFSAWFELQQSVVQRELQGLKFALKGKGLKVLDMQIIDEHFCKFKIATKAEDMELHYSSQALKNEIEEMVRKQLGV